MYNYVLIVSLIGFGVSLYSYIVEKKLITQPAYKPACDLSDVVSCSKPLRSRYANIFFISNSVAGMVFYALMMLAAWFEWSLVAFSLAAAAFIASLWLAYILYVKIKALCLICTVIYGINVILFFLTYKHI